MTLQLVSQIQIGDIRIPRILLGTSPFIGAGQFGHKALIYYSRFCKSPQNITKIIRKSYSMGINGIQVLPHPTVLRAIEDAERELGSRFIIVGTVEKEEDIAALQEFETVSMLLHGEVTDSKNTHAIRSLLDKIGETESLTGLVTHRPLQTLNWLHRVKLKFDMIMVPLNRAGLFMDAEAGEIVEALKRLEKPVIAKKTLAAGRLLPEEALKYVANLDCVDIVAIGIASEKEAEETFSIALKYFN